MDRNLWIPSFTTGKNFSASRLFTQDASFLTFFLPFSLSFSFFFFFSLPSSWFDRSRGMQRAIYNASVFGSISEENYHRSLWESPFTVSSLLPFSSSLRYIYFPPWETSKASSFSTNLSRLFSFFVRTFRAFSTKCQIVTGRILRLRAWFYLHPCWTARPIFGRDDNFKRLPSRVLAGTINEIPQRAAGSINKLLLLYIRPATFPLFST